MVSSSPLVVLLLLFMLGVVHSSEALIVNITGLLPCSSTCESEFCSVAPLLRYGKYCGVGYTGCAMAVPCDNLDLCCEIHDACIGDDPSNYLNETCNRNLLDCVAAYKASGAPQFSGNTCDVGAAESTIEAVMELALYIGRLLQHQRGPSHYNVEGKN